MRAIPLFASLCLTLCATAPATAQCCKDPRVRVQIVKTDFFLTTLPYPKPTPPPMVTLDNPASTPTFPGMEGGPTGAGTFNSLVPPIPGIRFNYAKIRGENRAISYTFRGAHLTLHLADDSTVNATCTFHEYSDQFQFLQFRTSCMVPKANQPGLIATVRGNKIELTWPTGSAGPRRFWSDSYTIDQ